jgi:hypothetical protein
VLASAQFRFTVAVPDVAARNQLEQDPSTTLRITAFAPLTTREQVRLISSGTDPVGQLAVADLKLAQVERTETNNYTALLFDVRSHKLTAPHKGWCVPDTDFFCS